MTSDALEELTLLIAELIQLAERSHPSFARHLFVCVNALRWEANRTPESDMVLVLEHIYEGASRVDGLMKETRLPLTTIRQVLMKLVTLNYVERSPDRTAEPGRPAYLYDLTLSGETWLANNNLQKTA